MISKADLISIADAADIAGVSIPTIRNWVKRKELRGYKFGKRLMFREEDVIEAVTPEIVGVSDEEKTHDSADPFNPAT